MYENYLEPLVPRNHGTHNRFYQRLIDIYYQNAFETIQCETSKLRTYRLVKGTQGMSSYITNISNIKDRVALSKLRLSNHKLHIETGRYQHLDKTLRFCPFCKDQVEDEIHFVISCPTFTTLREPLFLYIQEAVENFQYLTNEQKFISILTNPTEAVGRFVRTIMEIRDFLINAHRRRT